MILCFASRRRHTRYWRDWSSDVCSSDLVAVCPGEQHPLASLRRQRRKGSVPANCEEAVKTRVPEIKELKELRALRAAEIEFQAARDRIGNAQFRCRGPAVACGREGIADGFERAALPCGKVHGVAEMLVERASVADRVRRARCIRISVRRCLAMSSESELGRPGETRRKR